MTREFDHSQFLARARPKDRGPIRCVYPGCDYSFKNEWAATQHRRSVHNEGDPDPSALTSQPRGSQE